MDFNIDNLKEAMQKSKDGVLTFSLDYEDFIKNQKTIRSLLGEKGFIMFTEKRAVLCMQKVPNLRIFVKADHVYCKKDFEGILLRNVQIIGSDINKKFRFQEQYMKDIRDNLRWCIIITILFFSIFHFGSIRTQQLISMAENLLNVMGIFISMVFVFIGFIYSDGDRVVKLNMKGVGDKYFVINKYIINLSILVIILLIFVISFGSIAKDDLPKWIIKIQEQWQIMNTLISYRTQYIVCQIAVWISICSMIICFKSLTDYYFNDLKYNFFIASIEEKAKELKGH